MGDIFRSSLVLAETVVGSLIDQRSVVLYEQDDFASMKQEIENEVTKDKSWIERNFGDTTSELLLPTVEDFVNKSKLTELFKGIEFGALSDINGFNAWGISYMSAEVNITSDLCDHPIETGAKITDSAIRNPISAKVEIIMPTAFYEKIYKQVYDYYENKKKLMLMTKFAMYKNLVIKDMPYKLERGTVDRPSIVLSLREVMEVVPEYMAMPSNLGQGEGITELGAMYGDDTDSQIIGQKRYITSLVESL